MKKVIISLCLFALCIASDNKMGKAYHSSLFLKSNKKYSIHQYQLIFKK